MGGEAKEVQLHPRQPQNYGLAKPDIYNPQQTRLDNHITHETQPWRLSEPEVSLRVYLSGGKIVSRG